MKKAIDLILDERDRQRRKGFNAAHDDKHVDGAILKAVTDQLVMHCFTEFGDAGANETPEWATELTAHIRRKYSRRPIQKLVIAAAMLLAEIERRQRVADRKKLRRRRAKSK